VGATAGSEGSIRAASRGLRGAALRAIALLFGTLLALALPEIGLRVTGYEGDRERSERRFDARYGDVPKDSWIFEFAIDPARHRAVDLRGQLVPLHKPANETRVLFLGDSATEGAFVSPEQSYPRRFEALMRERDPRSSIRAINAGVWGMTTIDEYHLLADKLLPLAPDRVQFKAGDSVMALTASTLVSPVGRPKGTLSNATAQRLSADILEFSKLTKEEQQVLDEFVNFLRSDA